MNVLDGETAGLLNLLLPGLAASAAALLFVLFGVWLGRRVPPRSIRDLEDALRRIIGGSHGSVPVLPASDPAARLATLVDELSETLVDRRRRLEHRAVVVGQALEQIAGRGVLVLDRDMRIVTAGEGAGRLAGRPPDALEGESAASIFTDESFKDFLVQMLDRDRRHLGVTGRLFLKLEEGKTLAVDAIATDTTLPRDSIALYMEAVEPESGPRSGALGFERLSALFEGLADGMLIVRDGVVRWANPASNRWLGDDVVGRPLRDLVVAEQLLVVVDRVARAERGEKVEPVVARLDPDRQELGSRELELWPIAVPMRDGAAAAVSLRDLGRERAARRRSEIERARLSVVMQAATDGLVVLHAPEESGAEWRVAHVNDLARETLGLSPAIAPGAREDALRGAIAHRFADPVSLLGFFERSAEAPETEHQSVFETAGESVRAIEFISRPIRESSGRAAGRVLIARDVTRQRAIERELRRDAETLRRSRDSLRAAYEELAALNRGMTSKADELDTMNDELRGLDDSRTELIASLAHDLQTPLVTVSGYTQMILEERLGRINDEQRVGLGKITRNVTYMSQLIRNLLAMARAESSPEIDARPVDVRSVIDEVVERLAPTAEARRVTVDAELGPDAPRLLAEREGLVQVVENLVGNAIKFNREGGRVTIRLSAGGDRFAELSVADTGAGVPEDERDRVFKRFFRGSGSVGTQGSGIGLATVKAIVERHGGGIRCESRIGSGATFHVRWPSAASSETPHRRGS